MIHTVTTGRRKFNRCLIHPQHHHHLALSPTPFQKYETEILSVLDSGPKVEKPAPLAPEHIWDFRFCQFRTREHEVYEILLVLIFIEPRTKVGRMPNTPLPSDLLRRLCCTTVGFIMDLRSKFDNTHTTNSSSVLKTMLK